MDNNLVQISAIIVTGLTAIAAIIGNIISKVIETRSNRNRLKLDILFRKRIDAYENFIMSITEQLHSYTNHDQGYEKEYKPSKDYPAAALVASNSTKNSIKELLNATNMVKSYRGSARSDYLSKTWHVKFEATLDEMYNDLKQLKEENEVWIVVIIASCVLFSTYNLAWLINKKVFGIS